MESAPPRAETRLVYSLTLATALQWLGASAVLPLLPEYLRQEGGSDALVGMVMGAFFAAGVLVQFPAGWVADRIGRRPVLLGGLVLYAVASLGFALSTSPTLDIVLRALQGTGSGMETVAALALLSSAVPIVRRGRAVANIYGGQLAGLAIGPLIGSLAGLDHMGAVFVAAGLTSLLACLPVLSATSGGTPGEFVAPDQGRRPRLLALRSVQGALGAAAALGLLFGVYETCWTLLLQSQGAVSWQIGLSWTLFAVPFVIMARPGGWLADHLDRRRLVAATVTTSIVFCVSYPFMHNLTALLVLGGVEGVGVAVALPSAQSMLTEACAPEQHGRAQGLFATAETGAVAVSALAGGVLFGSAHWAPFVVAGVASAGLLAAALIRWGPVPGRVAHASVPTPVPGPAPAAEMGPA